MNVIRETSGALTLFPLFPLGADQANPDYWFGIRPMPPGHPVAAFFLFVFFVLWVWGIPVAVIFHFLTQPPSYDTTPTPDLSEPKPNFFPSDLMPHLCPQKPQRNKGKSSSGLRVRLGSGVRRQKRVMRAKGNSAPFRAK